MGRVDGKVALITGAGRGQGRSHALRLAEEGADIVALDFDGSIETVPYPTASADDLATTASLVQRLDARVHTISADVRRQADLDGAVSEAVDRFGHIDIVCANAGILSYNLSWALSEAQWQDVVDVNLTGVWHTIKAVAPAMIDANRGGSIIITSSGAGLRGSPNVGHYVATKHAVVGLMRAVAKELAPHFIRVNTVHPTNVSTDMILNEATYRLFRPELEKPTVDDVEPLMRSMNALPIPWIDAVDVSNAVLWLASEEARYVTGASIPIAVG